MLGVVAATTAVLASRWGSPSDSPTDRAKAVVKNMTRAEKVHMLHGERYLTGEYIGQITGNKRLGIPDIIMNDGPQGFRTRTHKGTSTQWPSGLGIAATWNTSSASAWGTAMGKEFRGKGANLQLGPGVCVARVPVNGRNFEYLSGEDPFLGATLVGPAIQGIQNQGVLANVKHYIGNNQETDRMRVNSLIDERTRMEIYSPPFEAAVQAGVLSVMCSYNKVNGDHACENNQTLNKELRGVFGYKYWVMSDWTATHSTAHAANSGLDQEMPIGLHFSALALDVAIAEHKVSEETLDSMVVHILSGMFAGGLFDHAPFPGKEADNVTSTEHRQIAREIARDGAILLKNERENLPLRTAGIQTLAVVGQYAAKDPITGGGGSGAVVPAFVVSVLDALKARLSGVDVQYFESGDAAVQGAAAADAAVVVLATTSKEGSDRSDLTLEDAGLAASVGAVQPNTTAVIISPGAVLTGWDANISSVLLSFMPGEQEGNAIADVLLGDEPAGRLPLSFPNKENEVGFTPEQYPGVKLTANYSERLEVGYRWYTAHDVHPKYPFGHGLSYASFSFSSLSASISSVSFVVENTARREGVAVPQLYLQFPSSAGEPPQQLKGFKKLALNPGEKSHVTLPLSSRDLSVWDDVAHDWRQVKGTFRACVGPNVESLGLCQEFTA
eukprot:Hpha_TRINITY_DN11078_c0_g1::TRINITY_DN11078_c0_g1_i1::g.93024::m.93024/K05349/bglX; beta-glucosidase